MLDTRPWFKFYPKGLSRSLEYPTVGIFDFLETSARRYPDKTAIIYYGKKIKYSQLFQEALKVASFLKNNGLSKGDRVGIYMQNSPQWVISYFGIIRANCVAVPINPMLTEDELEYIIKDSGCRLISTTSELASKVYNIAKQKDILVACSNLSEYLPEEPEIPVPEFLLNKQENEWTIPWDEVLEKLDPPDVLVKHDDLAMIPYTAGTTGMPKGCMHTHSTVVSNAIGAAYWLRTTPGSIHLATLPYFHVTGFVHSLLAPIYEAATIVLFSRWDRDAVLLAIEKYGCTHWLNITTMVVDLLSKTDIQKENLRSLLVVAGGGAPMPQAVAEKLEQITGIRYVEGYGLTETISQTHMNPLDNPKLQCLGIPDFGVDALIIDSDTGEVLEPMKQGELVINGPEVFKGYWGKEEETKKSFIDINGKRYFRTGDLCYMDEDGFFFLVDRTKRMINRAGYKVWPAAVESILYKHPAIQEAVVVGTPEPRVGEEVKAFIVLNPEYKGKISKEDIINWAKGQMAAYKYPRIIEFVDELPKSGAGKILWRVLQEKEQKKKQ
ncbi:long-chain fatty acid--CoA ligase [Desulfothermus okinawensis JCM 13304]